MTLETETATMTADRARLDAMRRLLGSRLAAYRTAAVVSQPELGHAVGRTRSTISKVEHGARRMPAPLWTIADEVCGAAGALVAEHAALARLEQDYRDRWRTQHRRAQVQRAGARARTPAWPEPSLGGSGGDAWPDRALVSGELAEELMEMITRLARSIGRRKAIRTVGSVLAALGVSGPDLDEHTRLAQAVARPNRVDAQVIRSLAATLAHSKRLEDKLGPTEVMDTVLAQHHLVQGLLAGDCADELRPALLVVDSNMASAVGGYLIDMGDYGLAQRYFQRARKAGHDARNPACAAYAAANMTYAAFLRGDVPTALDNAAAARSLAARTDDPRLRALAENMAAAAYALDSQPGPCMAASARAHDLLTTANGASPESPAYWVHHGSIDSQRGLFLCLLGQPSHAVDVARTALDRYDRTYVGGYASCQIRLGHALVLDKEIAEAARVLADAAGHAHQSPRLTHALHTARALMQPWAHTPAVTALDTQLHSCALTPTQHTTPGRV